MVTEVSVSSEKSGGIPEAGGKSTVMRRRRREGSGSVGHARGEMHGVSEGVWAECSPLTQLRSCEVDCVTWRAVGCEFHVPCRHTHPAGGEEAGGL